MKKLMAAIGCVGLLGSSLMLNAQTSPTTEYKIAGQIHLEGDGGWDYLTADDAANRLFVSHGTMVQVVDLATGKLAGTISDTKGVHGIALAPDLNKGFTSNGREDSVTVFDFKTLATTAKVAVTGQNPDAILYDVFSHLVFTFNGKTANATAIDAKSNKVVATLALDGKPEFPASDGKGNLYVNIEDKNSISVINTKTLKVEKTWPIAPGEEPSGLAIDTENHRLFAVCHNKMMVIVDTKTGKVIATPPIGERVDGVVFDPVKKRAYSSNGDGTITVVQEVNKDSFKVIENITTQKGARTIALAAKTHRLYLPTAEFAPSPDSTQKRPNIKPNSFVILDMAPAQ